MKERKIQKKDLKKFSSYEQIVAQKQITIVAPKIQIITDNFDIIPMAKLKNMTINTRD